MRKLFEGIEVKDSESCGTNNMMAVMSTMVTTGIIMDELGMFPEHEEEVEARLFLDPEKSFIPSDELVDYGSSDPLQILLEKENASEGLNGDGEVVLDATNVEFDFEADPAPASKQEDNAFRPVFRRMSRAALKKHRLHIMENAIFSKINYDKKRKWIVRGATLLPHFSGRMKKAVGPKAVATATV